MRLKRFWKWLMMPRCDICKSEDAANYTDGVGIKLCRKCAESRNMSKATVTVE